MQISLFTYNMEKERIDKTDYLFNRFPLEGTFRQSSSVIDPVVIIEKTNPQKPIYNYMYIEEFQRWYFINDIITIRNFLWEIHAHVDVLYTWRNSIKNSKCIIDKSEENKNSNLYLNDGSFVMDTRKYNQVIEFPNGLSNNGQFILICAGGAGSSIGTSNIPLVSKPISLGGDDNV